MSSRFWAPPVKAAFCLICVDIVLVFRRTCTTSSALLGVPSSCFPLASAKHVTNIPICTRTYSLADSAGDLITAPPPHLVRSLQSIREASSPSLTRHPACCEQSTCSMTCPFPSSSFRHQRAYRKSSSRAKRCLMPLSATTGQNQQLVHPVASQSCPQQPDAQARECPLARWLETASRRSATRTIQRSAEAQLVSER